MCARQTWAPVPRHRPEAIAESGAAEMSIESLDSSLI